MVGVPIWAMGMVSYSLSLYITTMFRISAPRGYGSASPDIAAPFFILIALWEGWKVDAAVPWGRIGVSLGYGVCVALWRAGWLDPHILAVMAFPVFWVIWAPLVVLRREPKREG